MEKRRMLIRASTRPAAKRHTNAFVTDEDREKERQAAAEQPASHSSGHPGAPEETEDTELERCRQVGDYLDRYGQGRG